MDEQEAKRLIQEEKWKREKESEREMSKGYRALKAFAEAEATENRTRR